MQELVVHLSCKHTVLLLNESLHRKKLAQNVYWSILITRINDGIDVTPRLLANPVVYYIRRAWSVRKVYRLNIAGIMLTQNVAVSLLDLNSISGPETRSDIQLSPDSRCL